MTAALEGGEWSAAHPGRTLPPGKTRYPFCRNLGGPQGRSGRAENLVLIGIRSRTQNDKQVFKSEIQKLNSEYGNVGAKMNNNEANQTASAVCISPWSSAIISLLDYLFIFQLIALNCHFL